MNPFDLSGRVVLVTGASSGLGRHFARIAAGAGAKVAACARRADRLDALAADIAAAGGTAAAIAMDVMDETSVVAGFDAAQNALGPIDSVIANAGVNLTGFAVDQPIEDFDRVLAVNLRGAFLTAREGARRMMAADSKTTGRGRILIVSSLAAFQALPAIAAYAASKAGVLMLGKALAREWANRGINVNMICPGFVSTELNDAFLAGEAGQRLIAGFPRRRLMQESDLDGVVLHLISDASRAITGAAFSVDDGQGL
ncbi:MAG TPA: SDR family NAD(P)-dependent oxidoreductase [Rhizomicrobium sp.]|jgi:NAD(P)-dependent dehydrogenase (short-subunit alcohol dehydrogenase family)|nr:SDR family NAD(P)-dependent oxidoreductase [Rhizomicrobium sp.]